MDDNLQIWIQHICEQELPVFGHTVLQVQSLTRNESTTSTDLAQAILQDCQLTTRILRIANSPIFNPSAQSINTVSKAVMYIGFQRIHDIAIALTAIDKIVLEQTHTHALFLLTRALYTASLSQSLAREMNLDDSEEYFIAGLLYYLGELAFWSLSGPAGDKLLNELYQSGLPGNIAQSHVLGTTFTRMTAQLLKKWNVSPLLQRYLKAENLDSKSMRCIHLAIRLSDSRELSKSRDNLNKELADLLSLSANQAQQWITQIRNLTLETGTELGFKNLATYLEKLETYSPDKELFTPEHLYNKQYIPQRDPLLQLTSLRKLANAVNNSESLETLIEITLDGIYHGIGIDNPVLYIPGSSQNIAQTVFTPRVNQKTRKLKGNLEPEAEEIIRVGKESKHASWQKQGILNKEYFCSPVFLRERLFGILYADRKLSRRHLDRVSFDTFSLFSRQLQLALNHLEKHATEH